MGRDHRHGWCTGHPAGAARPAGRGRSPRDPGRPARQAAAHRRHPPRRRVARANGRLLRLRAADRRCRMERLTSRYTRPAMTHVFVAPHPDDVALSCGGLIASLRELGQTVTIITVFSGDGASGDLSSYQREALGFGSKAMWPATEAFNRSAIAADWPTGAYAPAWAATQD